MRSRSTPAEEIEQTTARFWSPSKDQVLRFRVRDFLAWLDECDPATDVGTTSTPRDCPLARWLSSADHVYDARVFRRTARWKDYPDGPTQDRRLPRWARRFTSAIDAQTDEREPHPVTVEEVLRAVERVATFRLAFLDQISRYR